MANNNRLASSSLGGQSQPRPQPPRASSSGLHLPITSLASLHAKPSNNADNGSLSSSNTKTKTTTTGSYIQNNNIKPKKAAGFSLPLNNLPSVLPKSTMANQGKNPLIQPQNTAPEPLENNAQSKRCRFALKVIRFPNDIIRSVLKKSLHFFQDNSNTNQTSTSSNASTVIEQNAASQRRSRSPKRSALMQGQQQQQPLNTNATLHHGNQGGVEFRAPLMIEQARHVNPKKGSFSSFSQKSSSHCRPFFFLVLGTLKSSYSNVADFPFGFLII